MVLKVLCLLIIVMWASSAPDPSSVNVDLGVNIDGGSAADAFPRCPVQTEPSTIQENPPLCLHVDVKKCNEPFVKTQCNNLCTTNVDPELCQHINIDECRKASVMASCPQKCLRPAKGDCPGTFTAIGQNCYYFSVDHENAQTWETARNRCKELGTVHGRNSDLAVFELPGSTASEEEELTQTIARKHNKGQDVWIGANDTVAEGQFKWVQTNMELSYFYSRWHPDRPHSCQEQCDCLTMWIHTNQYNTVHKRGSFADAPCSSSRPFVCQLFDY